MRSRFEGSCLRQEDTAPFTPTNGVYLFNVDELDSWPRDLDTDFTLVGCLFGGVKLTKNAHPDKYLNSGYGIGFNTRGYYSLPDGSVGKNVIIFGVDISLLVHINNKGKDILIFAKGPTQGLNHTLTVETELILQGQYKNLFKRAL